MKILKLLTLILILFIGINYSTANNAPPSSQLEGDGTLRRIRVPILMYHYVGALPENADDIRVNLTLSTERFREHLDYLDQENFSTISLYEISKALLNGESLPEKPVILSFDDGHLDHYTNVFPLLQEYEFIGTFFIITQFADSNAQAHLTWQQIQEMADAGMNMESHTKTHPNLQNRGHDFLVYEILGSIESLNHYTKQDTVGFSYPAGRYDGAVIDVLETTNIEVAVTTEFGVYHTSTEMLELPRLRINNDTSVAGLAALLEINR